MSNLYLAQGDDGQQPGPADMHVHEPDVSSAVWGFRKSMCVPYRPGGKYERDGQGNRLFDAENGASDFTQPNGSHMEMATTGWANEVRPAAMHRQMSFLSWYR